MMRVTRWVAVVAAFLLAASAHALQQKDEGTVKIYGLGTAPCRNWLEAHEATKAGRTDSRQAQFESWIYGYSTAYSILARGGSRDILRTDTAEIRTFLDSFCYDNPNEIFQAAVTELIKDQMKR